MVVLLAVCSADESTHLGLALTAGLCGLGADIGVNQRVLLWPALPGTSLRRISGVLARHREGA